VVIAFVFVVVLFLVGPGYLLRGAEEFGEDEGNLTPDGRWSRGSYRRHIGGGVVLAQLNLVSQIG